jgi:hypothetical protein
MIPSFRALLAVDAEGFSRHRDAALPGLHSEIRHAVQVAVELSGLLQAWQDARVLQSTGDGLFAVLPPESMARLIHPFPGYLQGALADAAPRLRAGRLQLRLRVALHIGMVDDEDPVTGGISAATNDVHRLLDCEPLRAALRDSDPDVTFAAVVVSAEAFDQFVRAGYTDANPSQFTSVQASVKQYRRTAYLYVPVLSAREQVDSPEQRDESGAPVQPQPAGLSTGSVSVTGNGTQNVIGSQVGGSIRQKRS